MWEDFVQYVTKLQTMIMKVHRRQNINPKNSFTKAEYQECNELVFEMVFENQDDNFMGKKLQEEFGTFIQSNLLTTLKEVRNQDDILIREFNQSWTSYSLFRKWISRLFHHYNKNTDIHCQKQLHTNNLSIEEFKKRIFFEFRSDLIQSSCVKMTDLRRESFKNLAEYIQIQQSQGGKGLEVQKIQSGEMQLETEEGMALESQNKEYQSASTEEIQALKECLQIFSEVLQPKTNERTLIYGKLNERMIEKSTLTFDQNLDYMKNFDAKTYLKFASLMKRDEQDLLGRIFEGNESLAFIQENLNELYFEKILKSYVKPLITQKYGFIWLIDNREIEVILLLLFGYFNCGLDFEDHL